MTNFRPHSESTYCSMPGEKVYNHTSRWQWICHHMALRGCLQYVLKRLFYVYLISACLVFLVFYRQQYIQLGEYFKSASNSDEEIFTNGGFKGKIYPERGIYRTGFGDGINEPPLSDSPTGKYRKAAVATDHHICSAVGTDILEKDGGSSVDAAIATSLCLGVVNPQSTGIGGGPIVTLYDSKEKQAFSLTCRAETPAAAYPVLFQNYVNQEKRCRISVPSNGSDAGINIGVPGEIACYKELHDRYGRLPWKHLFGPTIKLCKDGFPIEWSLATSIQDKGAEILNLPGLRNLYTDPSTGELKKEGDLLQMPKYAETLELIAEQGPDVFYQGELADTMVEEIQAAGGVLTADDLKRYKVEMKPALHTILRNGGHTVFGAHPPSGSLGIMHILKILDGYGFTEEDLKTTDRAVLMLHRTIEASRFTFPKTKRLFDDRFESNEELVQDLLSDEYADQVRSKISDEGIRSQEFYGKTLPGVEPQGTTHLSVLGDDGIAVAISATITQVFGSKILGEKTGILYNSALVDFSLPGAKAKNGEPCEPASALSPGKRPVTQMCPTIIVDSDGVISHVIGGSGGAKLTPAVINTIVRNLWLGQTIQEAIEYPRIIVLNRRKYIYIEKSMPKKYIDGLIKKGHTITIQDTASAACQAIHNTKNGTHPIHAYSDFRKDGLANGY
ncbi:unnamed protein product [Owenia fusiformis]|uniref:Uncharacterized protein n=1 Tax=Owenia fusiformis TaxID=6347 RepID=A0A8J1UB58_OWEFU|nr:unnamed protein product [Owenia fusiformis]